jgi:iron complex outermembrane receptor protein
MKKLLLLCAMAFSAIAAHSQHTIRLSIKQGEEKNTLAGATAIISSLNKSAIADSTGLVTFQNIASGKYKIKITYVGLEEKEVEVTVPQPNDEPLEVLFDEGEEEEEEEVIVTATRSSRSIRDIPTRVETISGEELTEKGNMKPGDIRMMLNESTGIQTQQTSATSYNSSIRIQGLDGRYTQLLRDGLPLYGGFAGGLSLMQIAPLDLNKAGRGDQRLFVYPVRWRRHCRAREPGIKNTGHRTRPQLPGKRYIRKRS